MYIYLHFYILTTKMVVLPSFQYNIAVTVTCKDKYLHLFKYLLPYKFQPSVIITSLITSNDQQIFFMSHSVAADSICVITKPTVTTQLYLFVQDSTGLDYWVTRSHHVNVTASVQCMRVFLFFVFKPPISHSVQQRGLFLPEE